MTNDIVSLDKVLIEDVFRYVVGTTSFGPLEKQIDPTIFEVYLKDIYNNNTKEMVRQSQDFIVFQKELAVLKSKASDMSSQEILSVCEEIAEIAPSTIFI